MATQADIDKWMAMTPEKVSRFLEVVTPESLGQDFLIHLSKDTGIKKFIPVIGTRQGTGEDRTVPRVCTAPTILGCLIGYVAAMHDFLYLKKDNQEFKGGMKIYGLPFQHALRPKARLVYDAERSDEHWLVTYSEDTVEYVPEHLGNLFYREIRFVGLKETMPVAEGTLFLDLRRDNMRFGDKLVIPKAGYYRVEGPVHFAEKARDNVSVKQDNRFTITEITKEEYLSNKIATADLLGYRESVPAHLQWALGQ